jgi:hypothetical protein
MKRTFLAALAFGLLAIVPNAHAGNIAPSIAAAFIMKIATFEKKIASAGSFTIYVAGDELVQKELEKFVGKTAGAITLTEVTGGPSLPEVAPSVLIVGDEADVAEIKTYLESNFLLAITRSEGEFEGVVPVALRLNRSGRPEVHIWLEISSKLALDWDPLMLKGAITH